MKEKTALVTLGITIGTQGYEIDGLTYANLGDALGTGVLGFCGCGCPEDAIKYVADGLRQIAKLREPNREQYEQWRKESSELHGSDGARYFFYYRMDDLGLTEHGSSVPGWLTEKGESFLLLADMLEAED